MSTTNALLHLFIFALPCLVSAQINVTTISQEFSGSGGGKIGPDNLIYIADYGDALPNPNGTQIMRFNLSDGTLSPFTSGLSGASGNDFDSQGNLIQSNIGSSTISKITPSGAVSLLSSVGINSPVGVYVDESDTVYVCNCGNNTIRKISPSGTSTLFSASTGYNCPNGITADLDGNLYISNFNDGGVYKIDSTGNGTLFAVIPGANNGHLAYNSVDSNLYVNSHGSSRIYRVSPTGDVSVLAGSGIRGNNDGNSSSAQFSRPNGLAISITGDTLFLNSSVPTTNTGLPLNPSLLRMVSGVQGAVGLNDELDLPITEIQVVPNPSSGNFQIKLSVSSSGEYLYRLIDNSGSLIQEKHLPLSEGESSLMLDHTDLSAGVYILSIENAEQIVQRRVIIR